MSDHSLAESPPPLPRATGIVRLIGSWPRSAPRTVVRGTRATVDTLKKYVLEETYELLEAIDAHDHESLREEAGDFLFEAVFVAQLEQEAGHFTIADSVSGGRQAGAPASACLQASRG